MNNCKSSLFLFLLLCFPNILLTQTVGDNNRSVIGLGAVSTTKGIFVAPSYSFNVRKFSPKVSLLIGRHHTLKAMGYGINIETKYYPLNELGKFRFFFISGYQLNIFKRFPSSTIKSILINQIGGGYGFEYKLFPLVSFTNYFSIGILHEKRNFISNNLTAVPTFDMAGEVHFGFKLNIK